MSNEKTGYKKPPTKSQFKPGKSGNPSGRKKQTASAHANFKSVSRVLREALLSEIVVTVNAKPQKMLRVEALVHVQVALAMKGNAQSAKLLLGLAEKHIPASLTIKELMEDQTVFGLTVEQERRLLPENLLKGVFYRENDKER